MKASPVKNKDMKMVNIHHHHKFVAGAWAVAVVTSLSLSLPAVSLLTHYQHSEDHLSHTPRLRLIP